ncbi:hypothetical protein HON22_00465, partial [Candidatus Peregrinibacteria bacterium]|nr:hypothetical protein [Candidatus Peregrinibacteria bacterium]
APSSPAPETDLSIPTLIQNAYGGISPGSSGLADEESWDKELAGKLNEGIEFLDNLRCARGGCFSTPFNRAFMVPGKWTANIPPPPGTGTLMSGGFSFPGIPVGVNPSPVPIFGLNSSVYNLGVTPYCSGPLTLPMPCIGPTCYQPKTIPLLPVCTPTLPNPTSSSIDFRLYLSPTLTGGLGMAICRGQIPLYGTILKTAAADPTGAYSSIMSKCAAFALPVNELSGGKCEEIEEDLAGLYSKAQNFVKKNKTVVLSVDGSKYESNITSKPQRKGMNIGVETFKRDLSTGKNQSAFPYFKGLGATWLDAQLEQFTKLLQLPHVTMYYPQMGAVWSGDEDNRDEEEKKETNPTVEKLLYDSTDSNRNKIEAKNSELGKFKKAWGNLGAPETSSTPKVKNVKNNTEESNKENISKNASNGDSQESSNSKTNGTKKSNKDEKEKSFFDSLKNTFQSGSDAIEKTKNDLSDASDKDQKSFDEAKKSVVSGIENLPENAAALVGLQGITDVIENIPFFVVEKKPINIRIPWANPHELSALIAEMETWVKLTKKDWDRFISMKNKCYNILPDSSRKFDPISTESTRTGSSLLDIKDINIFFRALPSKVIDTPENKKYKAKVCKELLSFSTGVDMNSFINSIEDKVEILKTYKRLPRELAKYKSGLAYYVSDALNYVNSFIDVIAGWNTRQKKIVEKYIQLIYTITEILAVWKDLAGTYKEYEKSCSKCKVEAHSQDFNLFSIIASATGILPPPVIQFPKWPDIVIDLSHVEAGIKIILPELHVFTDEVDLDFDLKPLKFPDTLEGALNFSINFKLPSLPDLPALPALPDLPEFPSLPLPKLPDLPPPPKIPSILDCIGRWTDLIRVILKFYCMISTGMWMYPESELTGTIEALTNRSSKTMLDIDFNFLQWPDVSYATIETINLDGYFNIEPGTVDLQKPVEEFAKGFNEGIADGVEGVQKSIQNTLNGISTSLDRQIQKFNKESGKFEQDILEGLKDAQGDLDDFEDAIQKDIDKTKQSSAHTPSSQMSEALLSSRASEASREISFNKINELSLDSWIPTFAGMTKGVDMNNFKQLQKTLAQTLDKESYESEVLARTNDLLALEGIQETPDFVLAANNDMSDLQVVSASNSSEAISAVQKTLHNIQNHNAENAERIYENGIYIFNTETNTSESVLSYTKGSEPVRGLHLADYNKDEDDDIFYALGRRVFLKKSYLSEGQKGDEGILRQAQDDVVAAQDNSYVYPNSTQIGNIKDYFPHYRSTDGILVSNQNASVYISWKEDPNVSGYILERKNFIYGFDEHHNTPSDYIYLLKEELRENNDIYNLKKGDTSFTEDYSNPEYHWEMKNDFYYLQITALLADGKRSTVSETVLLSPQKAFDTSAPLLVENPQERVVVVKEHPISAGYTDSSTEFFWYEKDNELVHSGDVLSTSFESLGIQSFQILAKDEVGNTTAYEKNVDVFAPQIIITQADENEIRGRLDPPEPFMPFTIIRKRNEVFKMLQPKKSERFYSDKDGNFVITKDDHHSGVRINDASGNFIATVDSESGFIKLEDTAYQLIPLAASKDHPTQMLVVKGDELAARISYVSGGLKVQIVASSNLALSTGKEVSVSDENLEDGIEILPVPANAKYFSGGAALMGAQKNLLAAVSPQGAIRLINPSLQIDYEQNENRLFFLIKNISGDILAKVYIGKMGSTKVSSQLDTLSSQNSAYAEYLGSKQSSVSSLALQDWIPAFAGMTEGKARMPEVGVEVTKNGERVTEKGMGMTKIFLPTAHAAETSASLSAPSIADYITSEEDISIEGKRKSLELPFPDLNPSHEYYQAIQDLYYRNILKGYDDGTFQPNAKITRAEFLKVALGSTGCFDCGSPDEGTKSLFQERKPFPDIHLPDWYYYCVSIGKKEGMVKGYGDGQFHPNKNISRKEAVAVLLRQIGAELKEVPENYFLDVPEYDWAKDYVYTAVNMGLIKNSGGFTFPNEEISRGEFAFMASRILENRACREHPDYNDNIEGKLGVLAEDIQAELEKEKDLLDLLDLGLGLGEDAVVLVDSQVLDDGTQVDTFSDGRKEFTSPDGTKKIVYPHGFEFTEFPDGSKTIKLPDGTEVSFFSDGTIQTKNPDGSELIEKSNGDIIRKSPNGEESLESPISSSVLDDGTKLFEYADGSTKTISPNGIHTFTGPEGSIIIKDPTNAQIESLSPEGIKSLQKNNGVKVNTFPDGRVETLLPDTTEFIDLPDGTRTVRKSDGVQITLSPSGERDMLFPDGKREIRSPDGQKETRKPNGEIVFESPDGTQRLVFPDGAEEITSPNGTKIILPPNGVNDPLNNSGNNEGVGPTGVKTTTLPNGEILFESPDGTQKLVSPDGTEKITS